MVSGERKYLFAANLSSELRCSCFWTDAEVSEEVQSVVRFCTRIKTLQNLLIHFLNILEWAIAVPNDVLVTEMKVSGEPDVVHGSSLP